LLKKVDLLGGHVNVFTTMTTTQKGKDECPAQLGICFFALNNKSLTPILHLLPFY